MHREKDLQKQIANPLCVWLREKACKSMHTHRHLQTLVRDRQKRSEFFLSWSARKWYVVSEIDWIRLCWKHIKGDINVTSGKFRTSKRLSKVSMQVRNWTTCKESFCQGFLNSLPQNLIKHIPNLKLIEFQLMALRGLTFKFNSRAQHLASCLSLQPGYRC